MSKRVQLKHIQIDHNFFEKPKIVSLQYRFKEIGVLVFIQVLCDMGKATDGEIDDDCIRSRAAEYGWDEAKSDEFIAYCVERNLIHRGSKPFLLSNRRIQADQESMAAKQEEWREKKRKQREAFETDEGQIGDKVETSSGRMNPELLNTEDLNIESRSKKLSEDFFEIPPEAEIARCAPGFSIGTQKLKFSYEDWEALGVNFYFGDFTKLTQHVLEASDYLKSEEKSVKDSVAYIRNWKRKGMRFERNRTKCSGNPNEKLEIIMGRSL